MARDRYVLGYHGTRRDVVRDVVNRQRILTESRNDYDWLGSGVYFWEGSPQRALKWAQSQYTEAEAGVLGAIIDLGNCLDLVETEAIAMVREAHRAMQKSFQHLGKELPKNTGNLFVRKLDCAVFTYLHYSRERANRPEFETVRCFFLEGQPIYEGAGIRGDDHIQICVRDLRNICGYFFPPDLYPLH